LAFSHLAAVGLAAILEDAGVDHPEVWWTRDLEARPVVGVAGRNLDPDQAAAAVHRHAVVHASPDDWSAACVPGGESGLLSPRIKPPDSDAAWADLTAARRARIDGLLDGRRHLDLAMIGSLGEPAYWRFREDGPGRRPDEGASPWEMKTRNRGEDFVAHRLHKLALAVAGRTAAQVRDGLIGRLARDELGKDAVDSRTSTGLASPGPVDNALAWCALWGISALPLISLVGAPARAAGHQWGRRDSGRREEHFYLPVSLHPLRLERYRSVVASAQLAAAAAVGTAGGQASLEAVAARRWLAERLVAAVVRFPVDVFGSANAPERRALLGTVDVVRR
jgi:CRISPR-associated protein Csb3